MQSVNKRYSHPCGFDNYNMSENPPIRRDISLRRRFSAAKLLIIFDIRKKICIFHADRLFFIEIFQFRLLNYPRVVCAHTCKRVRSRDVFFYRRRSMVLAMAEASQARRMAPAGIHAHRFTGSKNNAQGFSNHPIQIKIADHIATKA